MLGLLFGRGFYSRGAAIRARTVTNPEHCHDRSWPCRNGRVLSHHTVRFTSTSEWHYHNLLTMPVASVSTCTCLISLQHCILKHSWKFGLCWIFSSRLLKRKKKKNCRKLVCFNTIIPDTHHTTTTRFACV